MIRLSIVAIAMLTLACGEKPTTDKAPASGTSAAPASAAPSSESEAAMRARFATEAQQSITAENANQVADELLKEIAADQ